MNRTERDRLRATAAFQQDSAELRDHINSWPRGVLLTMSELLARPEALRNASHETLVRVCAMAKTTLIRAVIDGREDNDATGTDGG